MRAAAAAQRRARSGGTARARAPTSRLRRASISWSQVVSVPASTCWTATALASPAGLVALAGRRAPGGNRDTDAQRAGGRGGGPGGRTGGGHRSGAAPRLGVGRAGRRPAVSGRGGRSLGSRRGGGGRAAVVPGG